MLHVLSQNRHLDNVVLCLDHDPAGIEAMGRLTEMLRERRYDRISCLQSTFKDWNEDLKAQHGVTPVPAQGHPKIEACREVCGELIELCSSVKSTRKPYEMLMEHYEKFSFLTQNEKVMFGKDAAVTEHLQSMSAYALLAVQEQYRQLEQPVKIEHLADELYKSYYPHQDRDRLRTKTDNLQRDITAINDQVHSVGIRTPGDKQKLISSYMSLALNCVKAHIFLVIEGQTQKTEVQQKRNTNQIDCEQVVCEKPAQPQYNLS
jgi:hypothetical protein